jgi:hypothetical protein
MATVITRRTLDFGNIQAGIAMWNGVFGLGANIGFFTVKPYVRCLMGPLDFGITGNPGATEVYRPAWRWTSRASSGRIMAWFSWRICGLQFWWNWNELIHIQFLFLQLQWQRSENR